MEDQSVGGRHGRKGQSFLPTDYISQKRCNLDETKFFSKIIHFHVGHSRILSQNTIS